MPIVKQSEFAALCEVSRASVSLSVSRQKLVTTDTGEIDTDHPLNASYLKKRLSDLKVKKLTTAPVNKPEKPKAKRSPSKRTATKPAAEKPAPKSQEKKLATSQVSLEERNERKEFQRAVAKRQAKKDLDEKKKLIPVDDEDDDDDDDEGDEADELTGLQIRKTLADIHNKEASTIRQQTATAILKKDFVERSLVLRHFANLDQSIKTNLRDWPMRSASKLESMAKRGASVAAFREYLELEMTAIINRIKTDTIEKTKAEA